MDDATDADGPAGRHEPIWLDTTPETDYDPLEGDRRVDAAVVGGGIAGLTTALELAEAGQSVAVIERDRVVTGVTGRTTAKLTSLHGLIYDHLADHFGRERARQYAAANEAAIDAVEERIADLGVDCEFERVPAYTYVESPDSRGQIRAEVEAARDAGLPAEYVTETALPYDVAAAIEVADQARFDPRSYLLAMAERLVDEGGRIFEETTVEDVSDGEPCAVETGRGTVRADDVVIASHFPVKDPALYFARQSPKRSYVVAARLAGEVPEGVYYDPEEPYFSVRAHPRDDESLVLIGGQNHRTGHGHSTRERYRRLERQARARFDVASIEYRWATQDYVSVDRVPFVGRLAPQLRNLWVATGFGGWGMSNGTAAGSILADRIMGRPNPHERVYRPARLRLGAAAGKLLSHNTHATKHMVRDKVGQQPPLDTDSLSPGDAEVFEERDDPVAVYRDEGGDLHAVSAVCTHMGCLVSWNDGEASWDCACHGSRFDVDGTVLDTPAVADLDEVDLAPLDVPRRGATDD